jgi:hypothetical protein
VNYDDFRSRSYAIVSDSFASVTQEQGGIKLDNVLTGMGTTLTNYANYTDAVDLCYNTGNLENMAAVIMKNVAHLNKRNVTVHIFVPLLKSPGNPIPLNRETFKHWTDAIDALADCRSKPYLVINKTVADLINDPGDRERYQSMIERMIVHAEKYAFVDYGHRFWSEQFRLSDERDPSGMAKHCHLTICRQRVLSRLCFSKEWNNEHKASPGYLAQYVQDPTLLEAGRDAPVEDVNCPDEQEGAEPDHGETSDLVREIDPDIIQGEPDYKRFWISEDKTNSCARMRITMPY